MLKNAYLLAKFGADTAENNKLNFAKNRTELSDVLCPPGGGSLAWRTLTHQRLAVMKLFLQPATAPEAES